MMSGTDRGVPATHQRVLDALEQAGHACTLKELVARTGRHPHTVREHLADLRAWGWVSSRMSAPTGRGRPAQLYSLAGAGSHRQADVIAALAVEVAGSADDPRAVGARIGRALASGHVDSYEGLVAALHRSGYDPEVDDPEASDDPPPGPAAIRLHQCPYLAAAQAATSVICPMHEALVGEWLRDGPLGDLTANLEPHLVDDAGPCLLHLRPTRDRS